MLRVDAGDPAPRSSRSDIVGSTAVPGLVSKPVIDLAVSVRSEPDADACVAPLQALDYRIRGSLGDDPGRRYYVRDAEGIRVAQLHVYILVAVAWSELLEFRNALRADPDLPAAPRLSRVATRSWIETLGPEPARVRPCCGHQPQERVWTGTP